MLRNLPLLIVLSSFSCACIPVAHADTLTFIVSDVASGTLGTQSFTNQLVTISATLPLDNLANEPGYFNGTGDFEYDSEAGLAVTINIQGLGTFAGEDDYMFGNDLFPGLGIGDTNGDAFLAYSSPLPFGTTLQNTPSSGPFTGSVTAYIPGDSCVPDQDVQCPPYFGTSGGNLILDSADSTGTGQLIASSPSPVPEPSTATLLSTGLIGALAFIRRRLHT
jgi:hypothetical protein